MSYGLESFCKLLNLFADYILITQKKEQNAVNKSEAFDYLLRSNEGQTIVKELEALEVIVDKKVDVYLLAGCYSTKEYNTQIKHIQGRNPITTYEFKVLKEVVR